MAKTPHDLVRIRPLAAADLEEIVRYLDRTSTATADSFLDAFYQATASLARMPRMGPKRGTRGRLMGLRSWPLTTFGPYILFYLPITGSGIDVVRVLHGARDTNRLLRES